MKFNSAKDVRNFMEEFHNYLERFGEEHGVRFNNATIKYDKNSLNFRLNVEDNTGSNKAEEGYKCTSKEFDKYMAIKYPKLVGKLGTKFKNGGKEFEVIGYNSRAPKNFVNIREVTNGTEYKCHGSYVVCSI